MELDTQRIRALLDKRDAIDEELATAFTGNPPKKEITCSKCQGKGHTARSCPQREYEQSS
jgi:hypothetical protein